MKNIFAEFGRSFMATLFFAVILCGLYPLLVFGLAHLLFPRQANGSLLVDGSGTVRGSALIAQDFTAPGYFHPRPSAAGAYGYDAANSGGSNLGPTSQALAAQIAQRLAAYRAENGLPANAVVPADAVTASGSGLDPDISPQNAALQAPRVAKARGLPEQQVRELVRQNTRRRQWGIFGEPRVNVMTLNFALDELARHFALDPPPQK
ncbi:MAG: K(+)-transporting ATPase subunit C [Verrucomicrobia bacterium]|nr:K(+)-transporting ATPase subunit C [Verrucomicrobiota bacterium]MDE3099613.1 K(+)-transporting ATPase subunit C [Verrucomicrobiota bacterium]